MVTREQALEQVVRFEYYLNFPSGEDRRTDKEELIHAFQSAAADTEHAVEIGDWLIRRRPVDQCRFCPMPAEVYAAAEATRPAGRVIEAEQPIGPRPGDEPFGGLADLIDDRMLELLERKAQTGTHAERIAAEGFLRLHGARKGAAK